MMLPINKIIHGDCIEVMKTFPDDSIDCVVTDPPYGMSFMGKEWDKALPPKEAFEQMLRVLKPGALAFVMSSPRQDLMARMIILLEDAGFNTNLSFIDWIYKTGFPKAYDVSKGIDKKLGLDREIIGENPNYRDPETDHHERGNKAVLNKNLTKPTSELAKKWDGWKSQTGLKPAHEPVLMVYKPRSESTIVDNVLKWGTGAINVDACRIPFQDQDDFDELKAKANIIPSQPNKIYGKGIDGKGHLLEFGNQTGRFPANLLVSDKAIDTGELSKSGTLEPHHIITSSKTRNVYGEYSDQPPEEHTTYGDMGDQSRYFDLDAWAVGKGFCDTPKPSRKERDFGLGAFPLKTQRKQDGSWGSHEIFEVEGSGRKTGTLNRNVHPTVKPVKLMAYLIELGCPPDGIVLDPFVGSGTTCIAAKQLRKKYIGIELNEEYVEIARARVNPKGPLDQYSEFNEDSEMCASL